MSDFTFRPATEADIPVRRGPRPTGSKYTPLVLALRDGPQVVEWVGSRSTLITSTRRAADPLRMKVSIRAIDATHYLISEATS